MTGVHDVVLDALDGDAVDLERAWLAVARLPPALGAPPVQRSGYLDTSDGVNRTPPSSAPRVHTSGRQQRDGQHSATLPTQVPVAQLLSSVGYASGPKHDRLVQSFTTFACQAPALTRVNFGKWLRHVGVAGDANRYFAAFDRSAHMSWISLADFLVRCALLTFWWLAVGMAPDITLSLFVV
eukprot:m.903931 g.903931  ORF g.903931 m.903931 type:complete len:182 (+) comp23694_c0_seq54:156-701(+)